MRRINSLQYLRAIAALFVVVYHETLTAKLYDSAYSQGIFAIGQSGVDIFFVVSGFIMLYVAHGRAHDFNRRDFISRRIVRIAPTYWLLTGLFAATALLFPALFLHTKPVIDIRHVLSSLLFIPDGSNKYPVIYSGWTLSFEMFFYVCLCCLYSRSAVSTTIGLASLFGGLAIFGLVFRPGNPIVDLITSPLLLEFAFGMMICLCFLRGYLGRLALVVALLSLVLLLSTGGAGAKGPMPWTRLLVWGVPAACVVLIGLSAEAAGVAFRNRTMLALGESSYSLYLTHTITLPAASKALFRVGILPTTATMVLAVVLSVAVGHIFFRLVERPLTNNLNRALGRFSGNRLTEPRPIPG